MPAVYYAVFSSSALRLTKLSGQPSKTAHGAQFIIIIIIII